MTPILYLITELDTGGAENMLFELASRVDRKKYSVSVCCLAGRGEIGQKLENAGIRVIYLGMRGKWDFPALFRLVKILGREKPRILHTFLFHANFMGRIAGRLAGVPAVISSVRVSEKEQKLHLLGEKLTAPLAAKITCVSSDVMEFMAGIGLPREKMTVVPNGIDLGRFREAFLPEEVKRELNIPEAAKVVGTVSRLSHQKRLDRFLDCAGMVLEKAPGVFFVIAGRGPLEEELKERAGKLGISGSVRFLGLRSDVPRLLSAFDVFMLTSSWEGMPVALLEAMAAGKPAVASAVEGSSEVVLHGETGFLCPPGDVRMYAFFVLKLLNDGRLRREAGRKARDRARCYSSGEMALQNEAIYSQISREIP